MTRPIQVTQPAVEIIGPPTEVETDDPPPADPPVDPAEPSPVEVCGHVWQFLRVEPGGRGRVADLFFCQGCLCQASVCREDR